MACSALRARPRGEAGVGAGARARDGVCVRASVRVRARGRVGGAGGPKGGRCHTDGGVAAPGAELLQYAQPLNHSPARTLEWG